MVSGEGIAHRPAPHELNGVELTRGYDGGRWVMARDLRVGDSLHLSSGANVAVDGVAVEGGEDARIRVFNLEVGTAHNFTVGDSRILVHNGCGYIYLRTRKVNGKVVGEYVGKALSKKQLKDRWGKHRRKFPEEEVEFMVLEVVPEGGARTLEVAETDWYRAGGGKAILDNRNRPMNNAAYEAAGGKIPEPDGG